MGQSRWNLGIQSGCVTNVSRFVSGDEKANALFSNQFTKTVGLTVTAKYKISEKFALVSGLNFTEYGFTYGLAKDYSLLKPFDRNEEIRSTTCVTNIPFMATINTPVNCNNIRFVFGLGVSAGFSDENWKDVTSAEVEVNESSGARMTSVVATSNSVESVSGSATWMIGLEKVLKNGSLFTFYYTGNQGFYDLAKSTVEYQIDGNSYSHTFANRGSFVQFSLGYQFMPFGSRKVQKQLKNVGN
jgi:hypothetical protein